MNLFFVEMLCNSLLVVTLHVYSLEHLIAIILGFLYGSVIQAIGTVILGWLEDRNPPWRLLRPFRQLHLTQNQFQTLLWVQVGLWRDIVVMRTLLSV